MSAHAPHTKETPFSLDVGMRVRLSLWALLLLFIFGALPAHAATPLCSLNGGSTYTDCLPPQIVWGSPITSQSNVYASPEEAAAAFYAYTQSSVPTLCQNGCSLAVQDQVGSNSLIGKIVVVTYYSATGTSSSRQAQTNAKGVCTSGYSLIQDHDPTGISVVYACRPTSAIVDTIARADAADTSNPEGCRGCNPVVLGDLHKVDWVVDYQNQSPYPIVWGRTFNGRINRWTFNYDRRVMVAVSATNSNVANATLKRQDGQVLNFTGARSGGAWTWTPAMSTPLKSAMTLVKFQSNADLTQFTVINHRDETETYNDQGLLTKLQDVRALPLTFAYDARHRLTQITDASGRTLSMTYPDDTTGQTATITDHAGNVTTSTYHVYPLAADGVAATFPDTVSDGVRSVGYVMGANPNDTVNHLVVLQGVIKPDGAQLTYNYDAQNNFTGLTDENGDRYTTYTYSSGKITKTVHGSGQETIQYATGKVTFPNGQATTFSKDTGSLKLTSETQQCAWCTGPQYKAVGYDAAANPISLTDFNNHVETRTYDQARGVPLSITQASGTPLARTRTYTWDSRFLKPTQVVAPVQTEHGSGTQTTTYTYDAAGNAMTWSIAVAGPGGDSGSRQGSSTYNGFGEPLTVTNARGKTTTYTYDAQGNLLTATDALNHTTTYGGYDLAGNLGWMQDPNGLKTVFTYDALQRVTQVKKGCEDDPGCHWETTAVTYNPMGAVASVVGPNGRGIAYHYDSAHRRTQEDVLATDGSVLGTLTYTLSASSEVTAKTYKDATGNIIQSQGMGYDALSRLTAVIDSRAKSFGQTWDAESNLSATLDPLGHGRTLAYDALNRLNQTTLPDNQVESLGYGPDDTVVSQTDALGHTTTSTYNGFGEVIGLNSPDSGQTRWTRDAQGNPLTKTDSRGRVLTTTYDDLDRPLTQSGSSAPVTEALTWTYDTCTHGVGKLCALTDRTGTTTFAYDRWGRVTQRTQNIAGHAYTQAYAYDNAGQLLTLTYPSGAVLTQAWANGRVVSQTWNAQPLLSAAQYDPWDKPLGWTWGSGRTFSIGWDLDGRVNAIAAGSGASSQTYAYDDAWRLTGITHDGASEVYSYDARDRLTSGTTWGSYTYDANSNRLTWLSALGPQRYGIQATSNRLSSLNGTAVTVDASGSLLSKPGLGLAYDDWSRLRTATTGGLTTTYAVNGLGERVSKTQGSTQRIYIYSAPGHLLGVYDGTTGLPMEEWGYLGERPVADVRGTQVYAIETDNLMAPLRVLNASNATVWSWENREPFGASDPIEDAAGDQRFVMDLRLPGQVMDTESGLASNGFRDYDPYSGRYVEPDPIGLDAGSNIFIYALARPTLLIDARGLSTYLCHRKADLPFPANNFSHYWFKTDTYEAGMGGNCDVPGQGCADTMYSSTKTKDHSGQSQQPNATCEKIENIDEKCVDARIKPGQPTGAFAPWNNCQTFSRSVLDACSTSPQPFIGNPWHEY